MASFLSLTRGSTVFPPDQARSLEQRLANYSQWARFSLVPGFINRALLEYSFVYVSPTAVFMHNGRTE